MISLSYWTRAATQNVICSKNAGRPSRAAFFASFGRFSQMVSLVGVGFLAAGCALNDAKTPVLEPPQIRSGVGRMAPVLAETKFGKAVANAVISHPALRAGLADVQGAEANLAGTKSAGRPRIGVGLNLASGILGTSGSGSVLPVLSVSQLLFDGGANRARIEAAKVGVVSSALSRETTAAQVALNAVQVWYDLVYQRRLMSIMSDNLSKHEYFVALIEERVVAGAGTETDFLTAKSRLASATAQRTTIRGNLDRAEASYLEIFGNLPAKPPIPAKAPFLPQASDEELIQTSPRLRGLDAQIIGAQAVLKATHAGSWPALILGVDASYDPATGQAATTTSASPSYDITNGGQRAASIAAARSNLDRLLAERQDLERQIIRTLAFLRSDARTGKEMLQSAGAAVDASQAVVDASEEQFLIGRMSILQLLDAQRDLSQSKQSFLESERDLALSGYSALALTGDILDVFGILLPLAGPAQDHLATAATGNSIGKDAADE